MNTSKLPEVSIVIVNHNGKELLKTCLDSLNDLNYPKEKTEIILIDNNSKDTSVAFVKKNYKRIKIKSLKDNNYCKALNVGIKLSKGEFVAFLNNDTKVEPDWLSELINTISIDKKIGAVGSKILFFNKRINSAGMIEFPNFYVNHRGFLEEDKGQYNVKKKMGYLSGAAILFRKKCLQDVGLFDEDYIFYYDEIDYAQRMKKKWDLVYVPKSVVYHRYAATINPKSREFNYFVERGRLIFVAKYFPNRFSDAISSSHLFYKNVKVEHELLFDILPDAISKLVKTHDKKVLVKVLPEFFKQIRRITDFEKYDYLKEAIACQELLDKQSLELRKIKSRRNGFLRTVHAKIKGKK